MKDQNDGREKVEWKGGKKNTKGDKRYSQHQNGSMKKVDKVFRVANDHGIAISDKKEQKGSENANSGLQNYRDTMQIILEDVYNRFNVSDVTKIKDYMIETLINERIDNFYVHGKTSEVDNVKNILSAVNAFQVLTAKTNVFKEPLKFIDVKEKRKELNEMKFDRAMVLSNTKKSDYEETFKIVEDIRNAGNARGQENRELTAEIITFSAYTSGRITNSINALAGDIADDGSHVWHRDDKGRKTRVSYVHDEVGRKFLLELKKNAEDNNRSRLFEPRKADGTIKSTTSTRKMVSAYVKASAERLGIKEEVAVVLEKGVRPRLAKELDIDKNQFIKTEVYRTHSARKAYAKELCEHYYKEIKNGRFEQHFNRQMDNEVLVSGESGKQKYIDKYEKEVSIANNPIRIIKDQQGNEIRRIHKEKTSFRDLTDAEKALFLASVDMGHYRISVMSCYIDRKEFTRTHK